MSISVNTAKSAAWAKLGIGTREKPAEIFPRFTKQDYDALKTDYVNQFGYTVRVPQWDDVVHLVPNALKSTAEIKAEKKENLVRLLESPHPTWFQKYSTVMTWIDDIQDTSSVLFPLVRMIHKAAPKVMSKLMPFFGWLLLGYDVLQVANQFGRGAWRPMKGKRTWCRFWKQNPFGLAARVERVDRIKAWKPGLADFIQAAQVSDQFFGVGLSLGPIMGFVMDLPFAAYRYLSGDPVKFTFDPPDVGTLELMGARGLKAAGAISSQGQVFTEMTHFWTYITAGWSTMALAGFFRENTLSDMVENPMDVLIPAPRPTDPLTIAVIEEQGLKVEDGIGWPFNGKNLISMGDYIDATVEPCRANSLEFLLRHSKDWYGLAAAYALDYITPHVVLSIEPQAEWHVDDTDVMKLFWTMIKAPLLPTKPLTKTQGEAILKWLEDYKALYGEKPGLMAIQEKFDLLGIPYQTTYPIENEPGFEDFFPPELPEEEIE